MKTFDHLSFNLWTVYQVKDKNDINMFYYCQCQNAFKGYLTYTTHSIVCRRVTSYVVMCKKLWTFLKYFLEILKRSLQNF